jgi:four helix bundle protein
MKIESFYDLSVWKSAHQAVLDIYKITSGFKSEERYRIKDQLCRAAISVPTNIAEGFGRGSKKDFIKFLIIARGSLEESKYLVFLSKELGYISQENFMVLHSKLIEIAKMINGLIKSLQKQMS